MSFLSLIYLKMSYKALGTIPLYLKSLSNPIIVNVFPAPVCPKAIIEFDIPSKKESTAGFPI